MPTIAEPQSADPFKTLDGSVPPNIIQVVGAKKS